MLFVHEMAWLCLLYWVIANRYIWNTLVSCCLRSLCYVLLFCCMVTGTRFNINVMFTESPQLPGAVRLEELCHPSGCDARSTPCTLWTAWLTRCRWQRRVRLPSRAGRLEPTPRTPRAQWSKWTLSFSRYSCSEVCGVTFYHPKLLLLQFKYWNVIKFIVVLLKYLSICLFLIVNIDDWSVKNEHFIKLTCYCPVRRRAHKRRNIGGKMQSKKQIIIWLFLRSTPITKHKQ